MIVSASVISLAVASIVGTNISAQGPNGALQGTITRSVERSAPVVLIVPGSGPTDRDGNNPLGVKSATYRYLAEELAADGVTSIRIDKRGMFGSADAVVDANSVSISDYVDDIRAWIEVARRETGVQCVWVLGHSEGGLVALAAARQHLDICGVILVATAGRPLGEVLKEQLRANPANTGLLPQANAAIDALAAGGRIAADQLDPSLAGLFPDAVQGFLISAFALNPAELVSKIKSPVLILQGSRDIQVSVADVRALHQANPNARLALLPDVNHVLKRVTTDNSSENIATYGDAALPLAPDVARTISLFVKVPR